MTAAIFAPLPQIEGGWSCIAVDPPSRFVTYSANGQGRSPSQHFAVLPPAAVQTLPVLSVAAKNAALLVWTSGPYLDQALRL